MGISVTLCGFVECPDYRMVNGRRIYRHNRRTLLELPDFDETWPALTRTMFSAVPPRISLDRHVAAYESQILSFGGSYNNMYRLDAAWMEKFERLLARLCWFRAVVMLDFTALRYEWEVDWMHHKGYCENPPLPPASWRFRCVDYEQKWVDPQEAIDGGIRVGEVMQDRSGKRWVIRHADEEG